MAAHPNILCGESSTVSVLAWNSRKIRRVVRSSLGAECTAFSTGLEHTDMFRVLYAELCGDLCDLAEYETYLQMTDALCVNDCKSLADAQQVPLINGSLMPPARRPNPPGKQRSLHLTHSVQRLEWRCYPHCARNTPRMKYPHFFRLQSRRRSKSDVFGSQYCHISPRSGEESLFDRRALSTAIMCRPIKAHASTVSAEQQARIRPTHRGPSALSSNRK